MSGYNFKMALLQYLNNHMQKVGEVELVQVEVAINDAICTKERVDVGKYSAEVLRLPYLLAQLGNTRTLKQIPSYK